MIENVGQNLCNSITICTIHFCNVFSSIKLNIYNILKFRLGQNLSPYLHCGHSEGCKIQQTYLHCGYLES